MNEMFVVFMGLSALIVAVFFGLIFFAGSGCYVQANPHQSNFQVVVSGNTVVFKPTREEAFAYMNSLPECQNGK